MNTIRPYSPEYHMVEIRYRTHGVTSSSHKMSTYPFLGAVPFLGTVTGSYRSLLGLIDMVRAIYYAVIGGNDNWRYLFQIGAQNFCRGLIEAIPLMGTFCLIFDVAKTYWQSDENARHFARERGVPLYVVYYGARPICRYRQEVQGFYGLSATLINEVLNKGTPY